MSQINPKTRILKTTLSNYGSSDNPTPKPAKAANKFEAMIWFSQQNSSRSSSHQTSCWGSFVKCISHRETYHMNKNFENLKSKIDGIIKKENGNFDIYDFKKASNSLQRMFNVIRGCLWDLIIKKPKISKNEYEEVLKILTSTEKELKNILTKLPENSNTNVLPEEHEKLCYIEARKGINRMLILSTSSIELFENVFRDEDIIK